MIFLFPGDIPPDCACLELVCKYKRLNEFEEKNKQKIVCMPTGSFAWSADWLEWKSRILPGEWDEVKVQVPLNHEEESWKLGSYVVCRSSCVKKIFVLLGKGYQHLTSNVSNAKLIIPLFIFFMTNLSKHWYIFTKLFSAIRHGVLILWLLTSPGGSLALKEDVFTIKCMVHQPILV